METSKLQKELNDIEKTQNISMTEILQIRLLNEVIESIEKLRLSWQH